MLESGGAGNPKRFRAIVAWLQRVPSEIRRGWSGSRALFQRGLVRLRLWWGGQEILGSNIARVLWFLSPLLVLLFFVVIRFLANTSADERVLVQSGTGVFASLFSAMAPVLAGIFAIVFAIALLLLDIVERRYNNPSLIRLYLDHRTTIFFPATFLWALLTDLITLANADRAPAWGSEGAFLFVLVTIFSVYPFVRTTARFLDPSALLGILERDARAAWRSAM